MITAQAAVTIDRPIEVVFDFLADARNEPRWLPGAVGIAKLTDEPVGQATRFQGQYARIGTVTLELVTYDRPHAVTFRGQAKTMDFDDAVTLTTVTGGTQLAAVMTARPHGVMRLMQPLVGRVMRQQFAANWLHLKAALEQREAAPAAAPGADAG
jgi:uncharacterized protein YndB with AHSA1/START domain